jgi:hypothetical protein
MPLKPGTIATEYYTGSMAKAIEDAFKEEWPKVMGSAAPDSNPQMQLLFIAIAKGVVRHLAAHADAFKVNVTFDGTSFSTAIQIEIQEPPLT